MDVVGWLVELSVDGLYVGFVDVIAWLDGFTDGVAWLVEMVVEALVVGLTEVVIWVVEVPNGGLEVGFADVVTWLVELEANALDVGLENVLELGIGGIVVFIDEIKLVAAGAVGVVGFAACVTPATVAATVVFV